MLETSVLKLLTMANLCYQLVYFTKLPCYTLALIQHPSFLGNLPPLSITRTGRLLHTAKKKVTRLPALVDNPHVVIQLFGGENVTLR